MQHPTDPASRAASAAPPATGSRGSLARREFLKLSVLTAGGLAFTSLPASAGPFTRADFARLVPEDKKLTPDWLRALTERGAPTVYRWPESAKIGMPVGGLCCGQVYLGGDGRLWHWDVFNQPIGTGAEHYARPLSPGSPFDQGFALALGTGDARQVRAMDHSGWPEVAFRGEYPLGFVEYRDPATPVTVSLEAFSPFIPLNVDDSSLPVTVMRFTVRNPGGAAVEAEFTGWLENAVCLHSAAQHHGHRENRLVRSQHATFLESRAHPAPAVAAAESRPDLVFDDFERETYAPWTTEGTAFGPGPIEQERMPAYQGQVGGSGRRVVNSHASAPGDDVGAKDRATGTLTSPDFTLERHFVNFLLGGGNHAGRTCVNLVLDDQIVLSATGSNDNRMKRVSWDVRRWAGRRARLQVVDREAGGWGNLGLDHIVLSDRPAPPARPLEEEADFGTLALALLAASDPAGARPEDRGGAALAEASEVHGRFVPAEAPGAEAPLATRPFGTKLTGALTRRLVLAPGASAEVTFLIAWHFPNLRMDRLPGGRHYATRFASARAVAEAVAARFDELRRQTRLWHDTWYDSTLPHWFLDRTFLNASILATSTCHRFSDGRFWGWEGVGCCHGTCGHVWQYAQAVARLFPTLERDTRGRVDFGLALQPDGAIHFRGEFNDLAAVDGQAGTILRALREHQMAPDSAWLRSHWPAVRRALEWLIAKDGDDDGLIVGNQHNTLDTDWFGPVAWLSGLYLAALRAGEAMATELGDAAFARRCRALVERGAPLLVARLFDGEYFVNEPDPARADTINSGTGCHIDQVFGQSWLFQVGLDRVLPAEETRAALHALWRYNFTPDVGPYRATYKPGRWYAMPGEGGLLMCTFPRRDWDYAQAKGRGPEWAAGYFNECMNGFEYQVAWHMIAEGLVTEGLAITRMIHDRYHPSRRNPWNEVECGDHYARSMASYGVFLTACGYEYHGPRAHLGFAPRLTPGRFRAAFTAAEGWGSYAQDATGSALRARLDLRWGRLRLKTLGLGGAPTRRTAQATATLAGQPVAATVEVQAGRCLVTFATDLVVQAGTTLEVVVA